MKTIQIALVFCVLLLAGCSTAARQEFPPAQYDHVTVTCTILGPVDFEIIPFRGGPLLRAFVPVRLEEPGASADPVRLILASCAMKEYAGPKQGTSWHALGSRQTVEVFRNRSSGEYYVASRVGR